MKKFRFQWLDGKVEQGMGIDEADAFTKLGYGSGAIAALDVVEDVTSADPLGDYMRAPGPCEPVGFLKAFAEAAETGWATSVKIFKLHWNIVRPVMTDEQLAAARLIGERGLEVRLNFSDVRPEFVWRQIIKELEPLTLGELVRQNLIG